MSENDTTPEELFSHDNVTYETHILSEVDVSEWDVIKVNAMGTAVDIIGEERTDTDN